ncbi:cryptochrome/photolyase family protein [Alphaproteobacteria bacterium HT1-32]|nr:cryptochrome/photolyase family protein [Alphaproteobacteria bacterium HT1-32]
MKTLRLVLGDQLSHDIAALDGLKKTDDTVLMMEVAEECSYVPHHPQKIVLILSAMRHFAADLRDCGIQVDYLQLDNPDNPGNFTDAVGQILKIRRPDRIVVTEPGEWRVLLMMEGWQEHFGIPVEIRSDTRFFASRERFADWARGRKTWRMEHFYREMRREHGLLMDGPRPAGGDWNYDTENRKRLPAGAAPPKRRRFQPDPVTADVMTLVEERFSEHFGCIDGFDWPVTRAQALEALDDFLTGALPSFGDYQDAMKTDAPFLYHSLISPALNIGLLSPREVCSAAEKAWRSEQAPLNATEGFVRQILGWREYVRGVYWTLMPDYARANSLNAERPLPAFYWTGQTDMHCLRQAIDTTRRHAYSHHIQRLMVTGNFALLAGVSPPEIERWYLAVYADAFEWVEMPNTLGMAVFADGGQMASKPYAASGAYINRMSDFCKDCRYDVKQKTGSQACPFNYLYWAFLIRNKASLEDNPRLAMPYRNLATWSPEKRQACTDEATAFLDSITSVLSG